MKQKIVLWLGIVSAVITIIVAVIPWLSEKAELDVYVIGAEYRLSPKNEQNQIDDDLLKRNFQSKYIYKVTITNKGEIEARDVVLILPYSSEYIEGEVLRKNEKKRVLSKPTKAVLGNIKPTETVTVYLWSIYEISENKTIFNSGRKKVIVSHSSGVIEAKTPIDGKGNVGFIINLIMDHSLLFYFALILIVFYLPLTMFNLGLKNSKSKNQAVDPSKCEEKLNLISKAWSDGALSEAEYQEKYKKILDQVIEQPKPNK